MTYGFADSTLWCFIPLKYRVFLKLKKLGWICDLRAKEVVGVCVCMGRLPSFCSRMKQEHPTGQVTYEQCLIIICHFLTLVVTFSKDFNCRPYPLLLSPLSLDRCSPLQSLFPSALVCTAVLRSTLATIATNCPFSGGFCCLPLPPDLVPAFSRAEVR